MDNKAILHKFSVSWDSRVARYANNTVEEVEERTRDENHMKECSVYKVTYDCSVYKHY